MEPNQTGQLKVAIIHEWLVDYSGSERVVEQLLMLYPHADLYALVDFLPEGSRDFIQNKKVHTSFIQKLPMAQKQYRQYLPLMPLAIEQFDLSGYDLIISSAHAVSKGVLTGPNQLHVSYVHTPIRYAWDLYHQYLREADLNRGVKGWLAKALLHNIRLWDCRTANGVDKFIANSKYIARRIQKTYRREATVIYPPVDVDNYTMREKKEDYYLTASRMVPYKKIDLIVETFSELRNKKLVVIGDGPDYEKIQAKAGPNIEFLGYAPTSELRARMQEAKAFVFAAEEDFGITPVEAQACGTPVIAFGRGGALETVRGLRSAKPTGVFFDSQTPQSLAQAVEAFELHQDKILPVHCRENALRFSPQRFREEVLQKIESDWQLFQSAN